MDKKLIIASILSLLLGAASTFLGFDFKGAVCGKSESAPSANSQEK